MGVASQEKFKLDSTRQQFRLLDQIGFGGEETKTVLDDFDDAIGDLEPPFKPRRVFMFSGHMIDAVDRTSPRFPNEPALVDRVRKRLNRELERLDAGPDDLALASGACGGDLLFAEVALKRGLRFDLYLPHHEIEFLEKSVRFAGPEWESAFADVKNKAAHIYELYEDLGAPLFFENDYDRNNYRLYYNAISWGRENTHVLTLFDGGLADGSGGTAHMVNLVKSHGGQPHHINLREIVEDQ
jgi:hypothetical protein